MAFLILVFLAFFTCLNLSHEARVQICHPNDQAALNEFASNLKNVSVILDWSNKSNCCGWDGVVCEDSVNGSSFSRVTELKVSGLALSGQISPSLGNLDQLHVLDLSYNRLKGDLPPELSKLKELRVLDLSHNMLTGHILDAVSEMVSIESFNISSNIFHGNMSEFWGFVNLVEFNISNNNFYGYLPPRICGSSHTIRLLDISSNHFTGGYGGLEGCTESLVHLHLDSNSFSGELQDSLYSMSLLERLSISDNSFSGPISSKLGNLSNLKSFVIFKNQFSGFLPNVFSNLSKLEVLVAHSNSFSGSLPSSLALLSKLQTLDFHNNSLNGTLDLDFHGLPNLVKLDLVSNHFYGNLPESLSSCRKIETMSLSQNNFSGKIPESFGNLTSLKTLKLSNNSFSNLSEALPILQKCQNLTTLMLTSNFHGEDLPNIVGGFEHLTIFSLAKCNLKGQVSSWFRECKKLEVLDLSFNRLDGNIPSWFGEMDRLFYLDLSRNELKGEIPRSLTDLKSLVSENVICHEKSSTGSFYVKRTQSAMDLQYFQTCNFAPSIFLSNNRITGKIWPEFGKLKQLHILDLSRNNITGAIPSSISNMSNLETLDLSFNHLTGSIPFSLNKLTFLSEFNVANNQLHGEIPTGGQFFSFPNSSFEGNIGLCGIISPCHVNNTVPPNPPGPKHKLSKGGILGLSIGLEIGIALTLLLVFLKLYKRVKRQDEDETESQTSDAETVCGPPPSQLVLFQSAEYKELTVEGLFESTNQFDQSNIVGCGGFGLVYKAVFPNGTKAAIKKLSGDGGQINREFQAEIETLSRAQHKNLVSLQGYCCHGYDKLLIYSYMDNGSLDYWLHETFNRNSHATYPILDWETRLKIAQGAAHGVAYLHKEQNIIHRDIKASNILLNERFEAYVADFGLARFLLPSDTHVTTDLVGTLGYIPPEYSQGVPATFRGDVYSFGVLLLELLTSKRAVEICEGHGNLDLSTLVFRVRVEKKEKELIDSFIWNEDCEEQVLEMLCIASRCIDNNPRRRPKIDQVVSWLDAIGTVNGTGIEEGAS